MIYKVHVLMVLYFKSSNVFTIMDVSLMDYKLSV